jgi:hypothetical protein
MQSRRTPRSSLRWLLASCVLCFAPAARPADTIYVVVASQSPVQQLTQKELLALYMGRTRTFPGGEVATPLDQARDGAARQAFYQALTNMDMARIDSYWARLHFAGQIQPPQVVGDDTGVVRRLRAEPLAIGYLSKEPNDSSLRVVLRFP